MRNDTGVVTKTGTILPELNLGSSEAIMATLTYDSTGRLLFTKEMKKDYTLLMPQMLAGHLHHAQEGL